MHFSLLPFGCALAKAKACLLRSSDHPQRVRPDAPPLFSTLLPPLNHLQLVAKRYKLEHHPATSFLGGAVAGAAGTIASYPLDLLRTTLAAQGEPKVYSGIVDAATKIYAKRGVRGLYRGLGVTLIEIMPYSALQFGIYDSLNRLWSSTLVRMFWGVARMGCLQALRSTPRAPTTPPGFLHLSNLGWPPVLFSPLFPAPLLPGLHFSFFPSLTTLRSVRLFGAGFGQERNERCHSSVRVRHCVGGRIKVGHPPAGPGQEAIPGRWAATRGKVRPQHSRVRNRESDKVPYRHRSRRGNCWPVQGCGAVAAEGCPSRGHHAGVVRACARVPRCHTLRAEDFPRQRPDAGALRAGEWSQVIQDLPG